MNNHQSIINATKKIIAVESFAGFNVRKLASQTNLSPSHLYYYTKNTRQLFKEVLDSTAIQLGEKRSQLESKPKAKDMLEQRIRFQFENAEDIVYILKYYSTFRDEFKGNDYGYVPKAAYQHILEVLECAKHTNEWHIEDNIKTAKIITHAINGFVLEYYPNIPAPKELDTLIADIHSFLTLSLTNTKPG